MFVNTNYFANLFLYTKKHSIGQQKVDFVVENLQNLQIEENNDFELQQQQNDTSNAIEDDLQTQPDTEEPEIPNEIESNMEDANNTTAEHEPSNSQQNSSFAQTPSQASKTASIVGSDSHKPPPTFHLSKQHTGMKNRSYGVGMAVTPTTKMEFDQESREDFGVVKINRPIGKCALSPSASHPADDVMSTVSSGEGLTEQGYNDLKFYHNKLW